MTTRTNGRDILERWPHRWFGFWREQHDGDDRLPSIFDFVVPDLTRSYDKARLRHYLSTAYVMAYRMTGPPCPFTGEHTGKGIGFRTDGIWLWLDDLPHFIDRFDVAIPPALLRHIEEQNFTPLTKEQLLGSNGSKAEEEDKYDRMLLSLDWPPNGRLPLQREFAQQDPRDRLRGLEPPQSY